MENQVEGVPVGHQPVLVVAEKEVGVAPIEEAALLGMESTFGDPGA